MGMKYEIVDVTPDNLERYDLFCKKSKPKEAGYQNKVAWYNERFDEGLRIKLLRVDEGKKDLVSRGFIEYIPGEYTWRGIDAKGYMVIHCIWVVGRNKNKGYGTKLLEQCLTDTQEMNGVAVVTTTRTWLPKDKLFIKHGFEKVDSFESFNLYVKRISKTAPLPKFIHASPEMMKSYESGITIFDSDQCPYTNDYVKMLIDVAEEKNIPVHVESLSSCLDARLGISPYGTFCVLYNGKPLTYHYETRKNIEKLLENG